MINIRTPENKKMNILFQNRRDVFDVPGGDTIMMQRTKESLEELGLRVDFSSDPEVNLDKYDIVHVFNTQTINEPLSFCLNAKRQDTPLALSTLYWNFDEMKVAREAFDGFTRPRARMSSLIFMLLNRRESRKKGKYGNFFEKQRTALLLSDILLPNAESEMELIQKDYGRFGRFEVVYNAVEDKFFKASPGKFLREYGFKDFVLCAGRIEDRKNQLFLIEALKGTGLNLVLIGQPNPDPRQKKYTEACVARAGDKVVFLGYMPQDILVSAYAACKVHVLPSWFETPGLASLEAGLAGSNVVTTDRGATREYFKNMAWYCNPADIGSIRDAVIKAYDAPKNNKLSGFIRENYTWRKAAEKTLKGYMRILGGVL